MGTPNNNDWFAFGRGLPAGTSRGWRPPAINKPKVKIAKPPRVDDRDDPRFLLRQIIKEDEARCRPDISERRQDMIREMFDTTIKLELDRYYKSVTSNKLFNTEQEAPPKEESGTKQLAHLEEETTSETTQIHNSVITEKTPQEENAQGTTLEQDIDATQNQDGLEAESDTIKEKEALPQNDSLVETEERPNSVVPEEGSPE